MPTLESEGLRKAGIKVGVVVLLAIFAAELGLSARQQSQTFDEACHIFAGYRSWKNFDFGINPEHPPLVKLVAAIPLLTLPLRTPPVPAEYFKSVEYVSGREFLNANDAGSLISRARLATGIFTILLAVAVFCVARSMWGDGPAFLAMILLVFEPNILAHGALVTTDMGVTFGLFLAIGSFYFYLRKPSGLRLFFAGLAAGVCLGTKHSGILIFPMLFLLAFAELLPLWDLSSRKFVPDLPKKALRQFASVAIISGIAVVVLWSLYGFRYSSRASGLAVQPPLSEFSQRLGPRGSSIALQIAHWHLLPESYLYGVADIHSPQVIPTFIFGTIYQDKQWFYFPAVLVIKSTVTFLVLCCLALLNSALRDPKVRREVFFLVIPPVIYFSVALYSGINFGVRHLLPIYPFLIVLIAFSAWNIAQRRRAFAILAALLVVFHIVSSVRAYPDYLSYANELWGGPQNVHRIFADSNVDWGQGLKSMKRYIDQHQIKDCWFAYFGSYVVDAAYYGIPCKPLPAFYANVAQLPMATIPKFIDGPVFISSIEVTGPYWTGDWANPYFQFQKIQPADLIANSILVFNGRFDISTASALTHENLSKRLFQSKQWDQALAEAEAAITIAPNSPGAHAARGRALLQLDRKPEAKSETAISTQMLLRAIMTSP
jgi:tetratricopeptide (TPR) repeat protein